MQFIVSVITGSRKKSGSDAKLDLKEGCDLEVHKRIEPWSLGYLPTMLTWMPVLITDLKQAEDFTILLSICLYLPVRNISPV